MKCIRYAQQLAWPDYMRNRILVTQNRSAYHLTLRIPRVTYAQIPSIIQEALVALTASHSV